MPNKKIIDSWLKSITPHSYSPQELADHLMSRGIEIESIDDRNQNLVGFVVGEVLAREKHPNADKLSVCSVTTGGEPVTVVCGAPNVAAGQKIVFAPVGTYIPSAGFTIERRKLRGVVSEGMICSEAELGLGESHDGILVLPPDVETGRPVAEILGDVIYEVDVTPNRADCLSHLGVAREVAALTGGEIFLPPPEFTESAVPTSAAIAVTIADPELCPRYVARVVRGVTIGPSPEWLQETIRKLGLRPRNNVIDITNYVLFECGHPLHAFDLGRIAGARIDVRSSHGGERFVTLDGREHELPEGTLLICDAEKPVALAGIMGGENSEIGEATTDVLLESAYFNPSTVRRAARLLGISTDASFRFERGTDINITVHAINRAAQLIAKLAGGEVLCGPLDSYPSPRPEQIIEFRFNRTEEIVGVAIGDQEQAEHLRRIGFQLEPLAERSASVRVPSWRADIFEEIDLIEEVARVHGYDAIPAESRTAVTFDLAGDPLRKLIEQTRAFFVDNGFTETVSYYLTDPELATAYGSPIELVNPLGRDLSMLRTSMVPSLARIIGLNERHGRGGLRLFEVGHAFRAGRPDQGTIPGIVEMTELSFALNGAAEPTAWDMPVREADLYDLRGVAERYLKRMGVGNVSYRPAHEARWGFGSPALAVIAGDDEVGRIGPVDDALIGRFDIAGHPVVAVFDLERLAPHAFGAGRYKAPSRFPVVYRDLSLLVDAAIPNAALDATIRAAAGALLLDLRLFDLYQGKGIEPGKKSLAYALAFASHERTLEDAVVDERIAAVIGALGKEHDVVLRGA